MRCTLDQEKCRYQIISECAISARGIGVAGLTVQEGAIPRGFLREVLPGALTLSKPGVQTQADELGLFPPTQPPRLRLCGD